VAGGAVGAVERVGLNALNGAACELGVSRERLLLTLTGDVRPPDALSTEERADAFRSGLREAVDDEERAGRLGGVEASVLRAAIELAPLDALLDQLFA
jgi:hypothetical protein